MVKKTSTVRDVLNFKSTKGGLYAIYPFDNINSNGFGLFKVGMAKESINSRLDHFFNYFPEQFRVIALMEFLKYPEFTDEDKKLYTTTRTHNGVEKISYVKYLLAKEKELQDYLIERGSTRIYSDGRVRNPQFAVDEDGKKKDKVNNKGATEWFYTKEEWIKQWFKDEDRKLNTKLPISEKVSHIFLRPIEDSVNNLKQSVPDPTKFVGELTINRENTPFTEEEKEEERIQQEKKKEERRRKNKIYREKRKLAKQEAKEKAEREAEEQDWRNRLRKKQQ